MNRQDLVGTYDRASLLMQLIDIEGQVTKVLLRHQDPEHVMYASRELVQIAMELAYWSGGDPIDALENGARSFLSYWEEEVDDCNLLISFYE
jgi:hypothetical protein